MEEPLPDSPPSAPPSRRTASSGFSDREEHAQERKSIRDYYVILRERLWIALPLAIVVAVGVGYYQMRETPMYMASTTIQWEKGANLTKNQAIVGDGTVNSQVELNNNLSILNSGLLRERIQKSFTPAEIRILQKPLLDKGATGDVGLPMGSTSVEPQKDSTTVRIVNRHPGAEGAALVANRTAEEFLKYQRSYLSGKSGDSIETLKGYVDAQKKENEKAQKELQDFRTTNKFTSPTDARDTANKSITAYTAQLSASSIQRIGLEETLKQVDALKARGQDLWQNTSISAFGNVPNLRRNLDDVQRQVDLAANDFYERHPKMIALTEALGAARKSLTDEVENAVTNLRTQLALIKAQDTRIEDLLKIANAESDRLEKLSTPYNTLLTNAENQKAQYQKLSERLAETSVTSNIEALPIRVLDKAGVPGGPYTPNLSRITRTCIGLGFMVFIGVAVGLSFIDDRVKSAWDIEHYIGVDLLGIIPDLSGVKDEEKYTLVLNDSQAPGTESFLSVYSSAKIHSKLDFPKSILVTSTIPGEGKTLISCNLAGSFARHGKRTLLIDCDLRRPMLHRHFRRENTKGLITWFEAGAHVEGDLNQDPTLGIIPIANNFSLLTSGGRSRVPTEILESPAFAQLLARFKKMYDLVVIDSPPLGAVTDSLLIAERADEVIYVCRFNRAYKKHIRMYVKALRNGKNELLGVVLNGLSPRRIEYYSNYRYYRSYKKYYGAQT